MQVRATSAGTPKTRSSQRLPVAHTDSYDWQLLAACRDSRKDVFFHPENERGSARFGREEAAKRVCGRCPVRRPCLQHSLKVGEPYGVWGGVGEAERATMLANLRQHDRAD